MRKKSHELQWLEMIYHRKGLTEREVKDYQRLKRGYAGEVHVDKLCAFFLNDEVEYLNDITLNCQMNTVQIDKILCVGNTLYVIDVKHYRGEYTFKNNAWWVGNKLLSRNIYEQLRRAVRVIQSIFDEADWKMTVEGVIVFSNPDCKISMVDSVKELTLTYTDVPMWLSTLKTEQSVRLKNADWKKILQAFEVESYRTRRLCDGDRFSKLKKGIRCPTCGGFELKEYRYKCICSCGHIEVKETAYVRTICEYGLIHHDKELKVGAVVKLFGDHVNKEYVRKNMYKHFLLKNSLSKYSMYENKGVPFEEWFVDKREYFTAIEERKRWERLR